MYLQNIYILWSLLYAMKTATMYVESRLVYTISNPWGDMKAITIFAFAQSAQMPPNIMYKMISTSLGLMIVLLHRLELEKI